MAQALLNNLTNIGKDIYSASNLQDTPSEVNFEQILDLKTKSVSDSGQETTEQTTNNNSEEQINTQDTEITNNTQTTTGDENNVETLASVLEETTLAAAIEIAVDTVTEKSSEQTENITDNNTERDVLDSEEKTDTEDINDDDIIENTTTITQNEDPTMNKQLQAALESPTTLVVLHSSQTNLKNQSENTDLKEAVVTTEKPVYVSDKTENAQIEKFTLIEPAKTTQKENAQNQKTLKDIVSEKVLKELNIESVSSSEEGESAGNLMQYQTPQEQAVKVMLHGDIKFDEIKDISMQSQIKQAEVSTGRIIEQITKQMEGMYNSSKVNIILNPASLGKVVLQLVNSKEGLVAHFTVTSAETQNALIKGLAGLKESLLAQGINVDNIVIKLSDSEMNDKEQNNQDLTDQEHSAGGNKGQGSRKQKQEKKNFEQMMFEINQA